MKNIAKYIMITLLIAFALLTLFLSSSVIFDWFGIREKEGNYVLFVVLSNFISSVLYLFAAYGFAMSKKWTIAPLLTSVVVLVVAQFGLYSHIEAGGLYETKTIYAMYFRITVTVIFTLFAYLKLRRLSLNEN